MKFSVWKSIRIKTLEINIFDQYYVFYGLFNLYLFVSIQILISLKCHERLDVRKPSLNFFIKILREGLLSNQSRTSNKSVIKYRIFLIFFGSGEGRGRPRRREEGGRVFYWKSQECGRGVLQDGRGRGAGRVSAANWGIWGGAKYFFSGPKFPPSYRKLAKWAKTSPSTFKPSSVKDKNSGACVRTSCPSIFP